MNCPMRSRRWAPPPRQDGKQSGGTKMQSMNWAAEHCDALREYHAKRMSYAEIAEAINAKFKTAYSRNAAIGRARRMGLADPDRPKPAPKASAPQLHRARERHSPSWLQRTPVFEA